MMTKQNDAVALTDEQLDAVAGAGRDERQRRRAIRRMVRAAKKAGAIGIDGRILWDTVGPPSGTESGTQYWDDGTGDPTQVN
jgi:hypothetical protein